MTHSRSSRRWCSGRTRGRAAATPGRSRRRQRGRARRPRLPSACAQRREVAVSGTAPVTRPASARPARAPRPRPSCCPPTDRGEAGHSRAARPCSRGHEKRRLDHAPLPAGPAALTGSALVVAPPLLRLRHGRSGARLGSRGPSLGLGFPAPPRPGISDNQPIEEQERFLLQRLCEADFSGRGSGGDWREQAEGEPAAKAEIPVEACERSRCIFLLSDTRG